MTNQTHLPPIVSVVGKAKVGKTTFLTKLIAELRERGYRVGVIKHSIHAFAFDQSNKDTWKHMQAGAEAVAFVSGQQLALSRTLPEELDIDEVASMLGRVDIVLTEGYKRACKPKIEVSRRELGTHLVSPREDIVAVVSDHPVDIEVPRFNLDDAPGVASFLETHFLSGAHPS